MRRKLFAAKPTLESRSHGVVQHVLHGCVEALSAHRAGRGPSWAAPEIRGRMAIIGASVPTLGQRRGREPCP